MPDAEVSIAALYADEIPQINFENRREMVMALADQREQGDTPSSTSTQWIPTPGVPLPPAVVNVPYNIMAPDPVVVPTGYSTDWDFDFPTALNWLNVVPTPGGVIIHGMPPAVGGPFTFTLIIRLYQTGTDPLDPLNLTSSVVFLGYVTIRVWAADSPPAIDRDSLPDAMVGVQYGLPGREAAGITIDTRFFPEGSTWDWSFDGPNVLLNTGLSLWSDNTNAAIRGTPLPAALTTPGPTFTFSLIAEPTMNPDFPLLPTLTSPEYTIEVWARPGLSLLQKDTAPGDVAVPAPAPGPHALLDGMVGTIYGHGAAIIANDPGLPGSWEYQIVNRGLLGSGLFLDETDGLVEGLNPALITAGTYSFDVIYTTDRTDLIIGSSEVVTFTVTIWPRPVFDTPSRLPDGMAGPDPLDTLPDLPETPGWYNTRIEATGIPTGPNWIMSMSPAFDSEYNLTFSPTASNAPVNYSTIVGTPLHFLTDREVTFTVTLGLEDAVTPVNPNINTTISESYTIKMWARYFLSVNIPNRADPGYVIRDGESLPTDATRSLYEGRRAVMPGQQGIVIAELTPVGFVRWEVQQDDFVLRSVKIGGLTEATPSYVNGRKPNGWWLDANNAYARVRMPPVSSNDIGLASNNVTIRGVIPTQLPDIRFLGNDGRVGTTYFGPITFERPFGGSPLNRYDGDIGIYGPVDSGNIPTAVPSQPAVEWEVSEGVPIELMPGVPGSEVFIPAPGFSTTLAAGDTTILQGMPTEAGTWPFRITVTLPGTMKLIVPSPEIPSLIASSLSADPFMLTILPPLGLIVGDVNRDGSVDLADVIMFSKYWSGELTAAERTRFDADAANIRNEGVEPTRRDFEDLVKWFSDPSVTSDYPFPIGSDRPRNPNR
jgi:hypothetical protein